MQTTTTRRLKTQSTELVAVKRQKDGQSVVVQRIALCNFTRPSLTPSRPRLDGQHAAAAALPSSRRSIKLFFSPPPQTQKDERYETDPEGSRAGDEVRSVPGGPAQLSCHRHGLESMRRTDASGARGRRQQRVCRAIGVPPPPPTLPGRRMLCDHQVSVLASGKQT